MILDISELERLDLVEALSDSRRDTAASLRIAEARGEAMPHTRACLARLDSLLVKLRADDADEETVTP